jgi:hypothetical protein
MPTKKPAGVGAVAANNLVASTVVSTAVTRRSMQPAAGMSPIGTHALKTRAKPKCLGRQTWVHAALLQHSAAAVVPQASPGTDSEQNIVGD